MTPEKLEELTRKETELLAVLPEEFRSTLSSMAYDRGHSAGLEEVVSILDQLVYDLTPAIMAYTNRLTKPA
jgi:hypothetical protein